MTLSITLLSAECRYADCHVLLLCLVSESECRYPECRYAECCGAYRAKNSDTHHYLSFVKLSTF
jgi:hypothetical protein